MLLVLRVSNPAGGSPRLASKRTPPVVVPDSKVLVEVSFGLGEPAVTWLVSGLSWCRFGGRSLSELGVLAELPPQDKMSNGPRMKQIRNSSRYTEVASPRSSLLNSHLVIRSPKFRNGIKGSVFDKPLANYCNSHGLTGRICFLIRRSSSRRTNRIRRLQIWHRIPMSIPTRTISQTKLPQG
jgi:hypothetical protein